jgi:serine/threonine protein kinase
MALFWICSRGAYRQVFKTTFEDNKTFVFKSYYWGANFKYDEYEFMRMDALITEKLSSSETIVDNYAFCALSMIGEAMVHGDMEKVAVPKKGRIKQELDQRLPLYVWNNLSGEQKLNYALQMAETVALLHGFPQGIIVHNDLQLSQFLLDENNNLKLNDFNRGEIMFWNEKDKEYCNYKNNPGHGDVRMFHIFSCSLNEILTFPHHEFLSGVPPKNIQTNH